MSRRAPFFVPFMQRTATARIRRDLDGLYVRGTKQLDALTRVSPVVLAANHVSWWDPMVILALDAVLPIETFALMDRDNLRRLPFFGLVGALPLDRRDRERGRSDLRAAAGVLDRPRSSLWVFPQGEHRSTRTRELGLRSGIRQILDTAECPVVPVAIDYVFREAAAPAAFVRFGAALPFHASLGALEHAMNQSLDSLHAKAPFDAEWTCVVPPKKRANGEGLATRLLSTFARRHPLMLERTG